MSTKPTEHKNKTGSMLNEEWAKQMVEGTREFRPSSEGNAQAVLENRMHYMKSGMSVGTFVPPGNPRVFKEAADRAPNEQVMDLLMDKLGARLAFERAGVRLYEGIIAKCKGYGVFDGGPSGEQLERTRSEELGHFHLIRECIEQMGGDPTAMSPSGDIEATLGKGVSDVISDARTDLMQSLHAILLAELADNASWESLTKIAQQAGEAEMAQRFEEANRTEERHLQEVKGWLSEGHRQGM